MSNFCMNCGASGTLELAKRQNGEEVDVFFESGTYDDNNGTYEAEGNLSVLVCSDCQHEQIDVSGGYGSLCQ